MVLRNNILAIGISYTRWEEESNGHLIFRYGVTYLRNSVKLSIRTLPSLINGTYFGEKMSKERKRR